MAERAARAGGTVARQAFRGELHVETKAHETDLVTETDRDAQRQVISTLREEFPTDAIFAEEDAVPVGAHGDEALAEAVPEQGGGWVVDPIDGTSNFTRGLALWGTSVAAVVDGETVGSATFLPVLGDAYAAGPDGATRDGTELAVSDATDPETFAVGVTGKSGPELEGGVCESVVASGADLRRFGSMQATLAFLADGSLDAVVSVGRDTPWDTLAGVHLVRSAGGTVTDLEGDPWVHDSRGMVASNGRAHDAVRDSVTPVSSTRTGPES